MTYLALTSMKDLSAFFMPGFCGKGNQMAKDKDKRSNDEVIMVTDDAGMQLYLSEKAANRLSWILTGVMLLLSMPVIILAFMMI